jgi:cobalt-precorrin 5A hydrolase / cobalt-factor III methyltransferase / precorrin-3B C17-methyltransferase
LIGLFAVTAQGKRAAADLSLGPDAVLVDGPVKPALDRLWPNLGSAVFFMGAGAAIRLVAPLLENKRDDPGVVCVHEGYVIALTAAGNMLAQRIAESIDATAVTTSDYLGGTPLDDLVELLETAVDGDLDACGAAVLAGDAVRLLNPLGYDLPDLPANLQPDNYGTEWTVLIDDRLPRVTPKGKLIRLIPKTLVVGVGSTSGVTPDAVTAALELLQSKHDLDPRAVRSFATIDVKAREPGIQEAVEDWGFWHGERDGSLPPLRLHTAAELAEVTVPSPATGVSAAVGTPSVAEAAALLTARAFGERVEIAARKTVCGNVTVAAARILP